MTFSADYECLSAFKNRTNLPILHPKSPTQQNNQYLSCLSWAKRSAVEGSNVEGSLPKESIINSITPPSPCFAMDTRQRTTRLLFRYCKKILTCLKAVLILPKIPSVHCLACLCPWAQGPRWMLWLGFSEVSLPWACRRERVAVPRQHAFGGLTWSQLKARELSWY